MNPVTGNVTTKEAKDLLEQILLKLNRCKK